MALVCGKQQAHDDDNVDNVDNYYRVSNTTLGPIFDCHNK